MTSKHTPAPWAKADQEIRQGNIAIVQPWRRGPDGQVIEQPPLFADYRGGIVCQMSFHTHKDGICRQDVAEANAHLIAAAPDMYEALKACCEQLERLGSDGFASGAIAAIAKAEGRS